LFVPEKATPSGRTRAEFERSYDHVFGSILKTPPYSLPGCSVNRAATSKRPVSTWLAFEGAAPLGADEAVLRKWVLRGVRSFGLVHSQSNTLAASSGKGPWIPPEDGGLTDEGRRFIDLVHRVGGVVDLSHASDRSTDEATRMARAAGKPIMATHSNARALAPHARNLTDEQIRNIAAAGGIVGINFHQPFLRKKGASSASIEDVVEHLLYVRKIGGPGSVAIGSDFEGGISSVPELSDASRFQRLARALGEAGLSRAQIRAIFFDNARRVLCADSSASSR
jgi:membrane dipeptidase